MSKKRIMLHGASIALLTGPNAVLLGMNAELLTEAHAVALSLTALFALSLVGLGVLCHFKVKAGLWAILIGAFVLALSNISYIAGIALILEGLGLTLDTYLINPFIINEKIKELEKDGKSISYTRNIE